MRVTGALKHMIPLKIQIKNFLSYGPNTQTIDFEPYHLICFSGRNGHGKSALLDAITWAIWGQARKMSTVTKADQGLLHLGQTSMMVIIDFVCNNEQYRIRRDYSHNFGKPYATLEFGVLDRSSESIRPLTDKTIRATQQKIEQTININFESFINSAFLRQGQSNEFSKKSPKERKEVLASILGLDTYEALRKRAFDKMKHAIATKQSFETLHTKYQRDLEQLPVILTSLQENKNHLIALTQEEQRYIHEEKKLTALHTALLEQHRAYDALRMKGQQLQTNEQNALDELQTLRSAWRTVQRNQNNMGAIDELEREKKELMLRMQQSQQTMLKHLTLKESYLNNKQQRDAIVAQLHLEQQLRMQEHKNKIELISKEHQVLTQAQEQLAKEYTGHSDRITFLQQEMTCKKTELELLHTISSTKEMLEKKFERRKEYYHRFISLGNTLSQEKSSLVQKTDWVEDQGEAPSCPLCEQNLSASRKKFLLTKFNQEGTIKARTIHRLSVAVKQLKDLLVRDHADLEKMRKLAEQQAVLTTQHSHIEKELSELTLKQSKCQETVQSNEAKIKDLIIALQAASVSLEQIKHTPEQSRYPEQYHSLKILCDEQEKMLAENNHIIEQQDAINSAIRAIDSKLQSVEQLKKDIAEQHTRQQLIEKLCTQIRGIRTDLDVIKKEQEPYAQMGQREADYSTQHDTLISNRAALARQKEQLLEKRGTLDEKKKQLETLEQECRAQHKQITGLTATIDDYQIIAQATGKDGLQALLIEEAIPEIEHEANLLLSKLTDNQSHIAIESLRDLKKGGSRETLDIKISDTAGIRPYEMFSGGEAFRIDFSLRIAISKLLARRSGTALQTLIIDEGFGSQDEEGLAHIMESIHKIQDDFAKIIIVSHLTSMKEQFPVHFMIEKGSLGSAVRVHQQG